MPGRLNVRGVVFSVAVVTMGAVVNLIIQDHAAQLGVSGLTGAEAQAIGGVPVPVELPEPLLGAVFDPASLHLPEGFQAQWQEVSLDGGGVKLKTLERKFSLAQTENGSGSEYYDYAAALFDQMSSQVKDPQLSGKLHTLSQRAQHLGYQVRQASALQFEGAPSGDMGHLQVHAAILAHLEDLNQNPVVRVNYDPDGHPLGHAGAAASVPGKSLQGFHQNVQAILDDPASARYPQTMSLLRQEAALLEKLSTHLSLRWESTLDCSGGPDCAGRAMYVRLYTRQTLPAKEIALSGPRS